MTGNMTDDPMIADGPPPEIIWPVASVVVLIVLACTSVRFVPGGRRRVVFRRNGCARVRGPGLVVVIPLREHSVEVSLDDVQVDVPWVRAQTADGVKVTVDGSVRIRVADPVALAERPELTDSAVASVARTEIRHLVARRSLAELATTVEEYGLRARIAGQVSAWGVDVTDVELAHWQVEIGAELLHWAREYRPGGGPGRPGGGDARAGFEFVRSEA